MAKSLEEILKKLEDERLERIQIIKLHEEKIHEEKKKQRQRYFKDIQMYEASANAVAAASSAAGAGAGGSIKPDVIVNIIITPDLNITPTSLVFDNTALNTFGATAQGFDIEGSGLTGDVTITAPTNFLLTLDPMMLSYGPPEPIVLSPDAGILSRTVYVQFNPLTEGDLSGDVTISWEGSTQSVAVEGTGITIPSLNLTFGGM